MDVKYFGASPPVWAQCACVGDDYAKANGITISPPKLAERWKLFYTSMGIDIAPRAGLLDDYCDAAAVGAKGCAKSFTFGMAVCARIQKYPGAKIGLVANSYAQAFGSGAEKLVKVRNRDGPRIRV